MKKIATLFTLSLFLFSLNSCCTSYCAEASYTNVISLELYNKNSGERILDNLDRNYLILSSESQNDSEIEATGEDVVLNLSIAKKSGMVDVLTLMWTDCDCTIATFEVSYTLNGDKKCCSNRSVLIKEFKNYCTDPDVEIIKTGNNYTKVKIMIDL